MSVYEVNDSVFNHLRHLFRANLFYCFLESCVAATGDHAITHKTGVAQLIYEQTGLCLGPKSKATP